MRFSSSVLRRFLFSVCAVAACSPEIPNAHAEAVHTVSVENIKFDPAVIEVSVGDRIVWINKDLVPHTATAVDKSFDSGVIQPDGRWEFVVSKAGEMNYSCLIHPAMTGQIKVK